MRSEPPNLDTNFYLTSQGQIHLQERGAKDENKRWTSTTLIEEETDDIGLSVNINNELEDRYLQISLRDYHRENRQTGRVFHTSAEIHLDRRQITQLRAFLSFVLKSLP